MNLRVSGKHMEIGDAFRSRIEGRIGEAIDKYFDGGFSGHVTVEKSGSRFSADCMVRLDTGISLQTTGEAQEPISAFDVAAERFEKRLRRYKRKLKSHRADGADSEAVEVASSTVTTPSDDEVAVEGPAPAVIAEQPETLTSMTVAEAVTALDAKQSPVYIFRNAGNDHVSIVYRRSDGNIGWIDTSAASKA
ncbi:ribosome-associated translation inhibitor RaiA [Mesorhizobium sp. BAC0120]|uniref:ribosome hibernation-promoting factor, HPF/YfiA family n=1 Tax=Mesorhizobium sp. BAC0120 TaxID=3090670 RepID=UPI00298BD4E5|nr:ribosome-associated translation inhibitor RaiA [Mesorhizobium sp. BAC0120]MDW6025649.1 ribosome-associated translation inhibitor RaiA [Mesorhizobium sp. BAC0120]